MKRVRRGREERWAVTNSKAALSLESLKLTELGSLLSGLLEGVFECHVSSLLRRGKGGIIPLSHVPAHKLCRRIDPQILEENIFLLSIYLASHVFVRTASSPQKLLQLSLREFVMSVIVNTLSSCVIKCLLTFMRLLFPGTFMYGSGTTGTTGTSIEWPWKMKIKPILLLTLPEYCYTDRNN